MSSITERLKATLATIPEGVRLVAISKYHPAEAIAEAYNAGQLDFGENKAQDLVVKQQSLPEDIRWHFTGHLQRNKIKYIAPFIYMIHSVDSYQLLEEINKHAAKAGRTIPCLLQIHIAEEETKFGFTPEECIEMLSNSEWRTLDNVEIRGIMCMASNTEDEAQIAQEFGKVQKLFYEVKEKFFDGNDKFNILSAGMSDDYPIAVKYGSSHIRVGSKIFN